MIIFAGMLIGALIGVWRAKRLQGAGLDQLQYGAVGLLIGGIVGMFATVIIERLL